MKDEIFGPVAPIFRFEKEEDAVAMANDTEFGLASYFYTSDLGRAFRVMEGLKYGMVGVNEGIITTPEAPFGGVKESGIGREGGHQGIEDYLDTKYVLHRRPSGCRRYRDGGRSFRTDAGMVGPSRGIGSRAEGFSANILDFGAIIQDLRLKGARCAPGAGLRTGRMTISTIRCSSAPWSAAMPIASATGTSRSTGEHYQIDADEGRHALHGGSFGLHERLWEIVEVGPAHCTLSLKDPHRRGRFFPAISTSSAPTG